ncbi:MAG TPA: hypothetical protein PKE63_02905 [Lacibacter sp.]|nr:hypothetical protein [Lacibacter sp.]HMO89560.1 hypothetical protein [Lacibacter sp.]HMP86195.1 hypothetical protein [Lacibacter sp.]
MAKINFQKIISRAIDKAPGLVVGSMASNFVATQATKMSNGKATPMMVAGLQIVAGAVLPALVGGGKKQGQFVESVGDGMMAQGAVQLAKALNLPGIGDAEYPGAYEDNLNGVGADGAASESNLSGQD